MLQRLSINSAASNTVEMKFFTLTIWTCALKYSEFTGVPAATPAIITSRARQKLGPALLAQVFIGFADTFTAINTYCWPKKLV